MSISSVTMVKEEQEVSFTAAQQAWIEQLIAARLPPATTTCTYKLQILQYLPQQFTIHGSDHILRLP